MILKHAYMVSILNAGSSSACRGISGAVCDKAERIFEVFQNRVERTGMDG